MTTARTYEAPGWFTPASEPGTILQVGYDPNYTGTFVELAIGDPPVFIQLPAELLGEAMSLLPLRPHARVAAHGSGAGGTLGSRREGIRTPSDRTGPLRAALRVVRTSGTNG